MLDLEALKELVNRCSYLIVGNQRSDLLGKLVTRLVKYNGEVTELPQPFRAIARASREDAEKQLKLYCSITKTDAAPEIVKRILNCPYFYRAMTD